MDNLNEFSEFLIRHIPLQSIYVQEFRTENPLKIIHTIGAASTLRSNMVKSTIDAQEQLSPSITAN